MGIVEFFLNWDSPAAEAALRRAIALNADYPLAHLWLGHALSQMGRPDEARAAARRACALDPLSPLNQAISSQIAFQTRDYATAADHARQAIVIDPEFWVGYMQAGQAYEQLDQPTLHWKLLLMPPASRTATVSPSRSAATFSVG